MLSSLSLYTYMLYHSHELREGRKKKLKKYRNTMDSESLRKVNAKIHYFNCVNVLNYA